MPDARELHQDFSVDPEILQARVRPGGHFLQLWIDLTGLVPRDELQPAFEAIDPLLRDRLRRSGARPGRRLLTGGNARRAGTKHAKAHEQRDAPHRVIVTPVRPRTLSYSQEI